MVAVVDAGDVSRVLETLADNAVSAWVCGDVAMVGDSGREPGSVVLQGDHPGW
jgi:hypothetical protein